MLDSGTKLFDNAKLQATVSIFTPRVTLRIMRQCLYCIVMYCTALYCRPWWDVMEDYMLYFFVVMSTLDTNKYVDHVMLTLQAW